MDRASPPGSIPVQNYHTIIFVPQESEDSLMANSIAETRGGKHSSTQVLDYLIANYR
ncbi:hypothetical protein BAUCODRAFT_34118 [Baudoinia panamericana UAMH 10762]|uniref:Uncharacterized protein n=1 Tax=Baudoinia panamericana (strain UAMH 10762) TaxID=717646 RepID=M2NCT1_BAUPA|nr:uncharacterized protein BAUCODRAFT_34118 [Baudoinia panamericana UAMH 10762]EMC96725.1 hypothetical protein BAUCODRAFT_34118 [Baudoinia panamericana UAMH 10762]